MHQLREAQATRAAALGFSPADLRAMQEAAPDDTVRSIVADNRAVPGQRSALPRSQQASDVRARAPGDGAGWMRETRLMDAQDRRDRLALVQEEARRLALVKAAEKPSERE